MGVLEAADIHLVKHRLGGQGRDTCGFRQGLRDGESSIPHVLERNIKLNPLLPLFCKKAQHSPRG